LGLSYRALIGSLAERFARPPLAGSTRWRSITPQRADDGTNRPLTRARLTLLLLELRSLKAW